MPKTKEVEIIFALPNQNVYKAKDY